MSIAFFAAMILSMLVLVVVSLCKVAGASIIFGLSASVLFVVTAWSGYRKNPSNRRFFAFVFAGLLSSLCGDVMMAMNRGQGLYFLLGVGCFAVAHFLYFLGYCSRVKFGGKDILLFLCLYAPVLLLILYGGFAFGSLKFIVAGYAVIICLMLSKSLSMAAFFRESPRQSVMLMTGSILFFLSDFSLLFFIFFPHAEPVLRQLNWMLYYPGQGLLALSFAYALSAKYKNGLEVDPCVL